MTDEELQILKTEYENKITKLIVLQVISEMN